MEKRKIHIVDTTLRDGSHAVSHSFSPEQVMAIANCLNVFEDVSCDYVVIIKPAHKVEGWESEMANMSEKKQKKQQELVNIVLEIDTLWIFEQLGYEYVGETTSLQVFRRL